MAVIPMQKVQIVVHRTDTDALLNVLQRSGTMEFTEVQSEAIAAADAVFPHAQLLPRVQHAVGFLKPYEVKKSLWRTLRDGTTVDLTEAAVAKCAADTDAVALIVADQEALQVELADKNDVVRRLEEQVALLRVWKAVPIKLSELTTASTYTKLVQTVNDRRSSAQLSLAATLSEFLATHAIPSQITSVATDLAAVTVATEALAPTELQKQLEELGLEIVAVPAGSELADVELVAVEEALAAAKGELGNVHDQAEHFAHTHLAQLQIAGEVLAWERDRFAVVETGGATASTIVMEGWINATKRSAIEAELASKQIVATVSDLTPAEDEQPPVDIVNGPLVQPFEMVTRLYGMPGHTDLDPTMFLAGFFFLFFGLCLTDVGYGAFLVAMGAFVLLFFKVADNIRLFAKLLLFIGMATVFVGMLFGGYFGIALESLPAPLRALQVFDPIGNPLPVFYLALGLGVFQVMVGMVLKIYSDSRNGKLVDGILDQGPWLFLFSVGILYVLAMVDYVSIASETITKLAYLGLAVLLITGVRSSRSIGQVIMNAGGSLYASVGYLSDILSYSRLLALGLATTALAFAINLIAEIVSGTPYVGAILAIVILVIGHAFTLAVNTLGAFIHSARLQFVEFFGKFVVGTGREFKPLSRTQKYITVAKE